MQNTEIGQLSGEYETAKDDALSSTSGLVRGWARQIELASEEEKDWRSDVEQAYEVYAAGKDTAVGANYNLYHANIETLCPALYNSEPIPDVRRRFNDKDPVGRVACDMISRALSISCDEYDFSGEMKDTVRDFAVAGRGLGRVFLEQQLIDVGDESAPVEDVGDQDVYFRTVPWASFRRGPGRTWDDVPWIAFAHYMTRDEMVRISEAGKKVPLDYRQEKSGEWEAGAQNDNPESDIFRRALVWEIWDKATRKVRFLAPSYEHDFLLVKDDPLRLEEFFPIPKPMMTGHRTGQMVPLSPYRIQKPLLKEIDELAVRIKKLVQQLRPRALSAGGVDIEALAIADDGELVEVTEKVLHLIEGGGVDKLLSWFPLDPVVKAIEQLAVRLEVLKQQLYEVSGLADILRGQSNAQETLGAQQIKSQWASLRIQQAQTEVQRFAADVFNIKAELISKHFRPENIIAMTGAAPDAPETQQALLLMRDDHAREFRIDIETDSTIRADTTKNMEQMAQFVQGSGTYFQSIAPIVQAGGMSKLAAIAIYSAFCRNFKLGKEVDAVLDQLSDEARKQEQQPQPPSPDVQKAQMEMQLTQQKAQADMQVAQQKAQMEGASLQAKVQHDERMAQLAEQKAIMEIEIKKIDLAMKREEAALGLQVKQHEMAMQAQSAQMKNRADMQATAMKLDAAQQGNAIKLDAMKKQAAAKAKQAPGQA